MFTRHAPARGSAVAVARPAGAGHHPDDGSQDPRTYRRVRIGHICPECNSRTCAEDLLQIFFPTVIGELAMAYVPLSLQVSASPNVNSASRLTRLFAQVRGLASGL